MHAQRRQLLALVMEMQIDSDEKGMHYSKKGQKSRTLFLKLPLSRRICPQCRMALRGQIAFVVVGEVDIAGILELECPMCGHKGVFIPH